MTSSTLIHFTLLAQLLDGCANWDDADLPLRLRVKIPPTAALCAVALDIINDLFRHQPSRRLGLLASLCLGYGLSLRPGEYLTNPHRLVPLKQKANSSRCMLLFLWRHCYQRLLASPVSTWCPPAPPTLLSSSTT